MRILELSSSFYPETFIWEHVNAIDTIDSVDVVLYHPQKKGEQLNKHNEKKLLEVKDIPLIKRQFLKMLRVNLKSYVFSKNIKQFKKFNPDVIHFHFGWTAYKYIEFAQVLKLPYSVSILGSDLLIRPLIDNTYKEKLISILENASGIHVVSDNLKDELENNYQLKCPIDLIRTPVDKSKWIGGEINNNDDIINLLAIGRLHWVKDFGELIIQFAEVCKTKNNVELTIIGGGAEKEKLSFLIHKFNLNNKVRLTGYLPPNEILKELNKASIFVLTSWSEGFPNVIVEATFSKTLCIVPDHLKFDSVFNNDSVVYYNKMNHNDLSKTIIKTIELDKITKNKMIDNAEKIINENFNSSKHGQDFFNFLNTRVLNKK